MSLHRTKAAIIGLLEANRVNEWVVTEKLGNALRRKNIAQPSRTPRFQFIEKQVPAAFQIIHLNKALYSTNRTNCH